MCKFQFRNHHIAFSLVVILALLTFSGKAITYYVSSAGNDSNPGTSENLAWRSLTKINNFYKLLPGDKVLFRRGDTWIGTLKINASGTAGNPIVYGAYGTGDNPKIYGSEVISGWTLHSGNIYKATFNTEITQLFVNDVKMKLARLTNTGYNTVNAVKSQTQFSCNALNAGFNYSGARVLLRTENWYSIMRTVTSSSSNTLTINSAPAGTIKLNQGFLLMNKLEFLDSPGEWYYDAATKTVYLWTPNGDSPANHTVRGSVEANGIYMVGKNYVTIQDFHILQQKEVGIYLESGVGISSTNIIIQRNSISGQEGVGIWDESSISQNFTIQNNEINDCNGIGIHLWIKNSVIRDNLVSNIGSFDKLGFNGTWNDNGGAGIEISGNGNTIEYNRVVGTNYNGIFWRGNSVIQYNFIKNACLYKSDGGGIYTGGTTAAGSIVRYNIVDNVVGNQEGGISGRNFGEGIYLDEPSLNILCEYNTIFQCTDAGIMMHKNENHVIRHNTIMDARYGVFVAQSSGTAKSNITNNLIVVNSEKDDYEPRQLLIRYASGNSFFDYNTYINSFENDLVFKDSKDNFIDFDQWKITVKADFNSEYIKNTLSKNESQKLIYNDTKQIKIFNLGSSIFHDIYGKPLNDTFHLKPFTSKILIGKNFNKINQYPVVSDQSYYLVSPVKENEWIGQLFAFDPDTVQEIKFKIIQGNDNEMFFLDSLTGDLFLKKYIQTSKDTSITLIVEVTDNSENPLSKIAKVSIIISGTDISPPVIRSFTIPPDAISLKIPLTELNVTDDIGVTAYKFTFSDQKPLPNDEDWLTSVPVYIVALKEGLNLIYAWAKDSAGNISNSKNASVFIKLPDFSNTFSEYLFDEPDGTADVIDSHGSNHGIINGSFHRIQGTTGGGLELKGNGYINFGKVFGENVRDELTLSAWIKPNSGGDNFQGIIMHGGPDVDSYALYINPETKIIGFKTSGTSNAWVSIDNMNVLWDGNWHHVVARYNGNDKVIYLDNIIILKIDATGEIDSGWKYNLLVGAGRDEISPSLLYDGLIDEVRVYNYALTDHEIGELYHPVNRNLKKTFTNEDITICEGQEYMGFSETGQYERILQRKLESASGADSVVYTNLLVNPVYYTFLNATICHEQTYTFGNRILNKTGEYAKILNSVNGCDSTVILSLTVLPEQKITFNISICEGEIYNFGNIPLRASGEYYEIYKSTNGCDSTVFLSLKVNPAYNITENITINSNENYLGWTEEGIYQRSLISSTGCDSTVITNLTVQQSFTQSIELLKGWNIFSSYIIPSENNMENVLNAIRVNGSLSKAIDEENRTFEPYANGNEWLNSIGNFRETEGYKIKMEKDAILEITGKQISLPLSIDIKKGTNIISFPLNSTADAMVVIQPLIDAEILLKVQDEKGQSIENWENLGWINDIGYFTPGEGYLIQANKPGTLKIFENYKKTGQYNSELFDTDYFIKCFEGNGLGHMNFNLIGLKNVPLFEGDEIAVFDRNLCVGAVKLSTKNIELDLISIPASATEKNLNNGFNDGNTYEIRIWKKQEQETATAFTEIISGESVFKSQSSVFLKLTELSKNSEIFDVFPNPAKDYFYIRSQYINEDGARLNIFDLSGRIVLTSFLKSSFEFIDVKKLNSGVYVLKINYKNNVVTRKIVINS